jgi:predicted dehydrogenase
MPRLLYIGQTPVEGTGSPVVVRRHLARLAAQGWQIAVICDHAPAAGGLPKDWVAHELPLRRFWWPAFRPHSVWSRRLRTWLLARECRRLTRSQPPDAVLGYLSAHTDFLPEVAANFTRLCRVPLTLLVHDDALAFHSSSAERASLTKRRACILARAATTWFVSSELAAACAVPEAQRQTLPPLPEGWSAAPAAWKPASAARPRIYYAGFIWPQQYALLADIARCVDTNGGRLVLLTRDTPELRAFLIAEPAGWVCPFASNHEALAELVENASGIIVAYSQKLSEMPWIATSFPSKLVEYVQLGVPCAIVAPAGSAVSAWAAREKFTPSFAPYDLTGLAKWIVSLGKAEEWNRESVRSLALARGIFDPVAIHARFEAGLLPGVTPAAETRTPVRSVQASLAAEPLPVVLIGCGAVSQQFYGPALRALELAKVLRVIALVDPMPAARRPLEARFPRALSVKSTDDILSVTPDALAIIATPPRFHAVQTEAAFAAGLHVLCEKPLAATSLEAERMIAAAARADRVLAAGHYKRFFPAHRAIKILIERGIFGPLRSIEIVEGGKFSWPAATDSFFRRDQTPGGVLLDTGVHVLDLLLWWLGEPIAFNYADDAFGGLEANCRLEATFPNEVSVSVHLSRDWATPNSAFFRFSRAAVHCRVNASNRLELVLDGLPMTFAAELRAPLPAEPAPVTAPLETNPQAFIAQLIDVCDAIRSHRAPAVTGTDGLHALRWIERCYLGRAPLNQSWLTHAP